MEFLELLKTDRPVLLDGGMGTMLQARGLPVGATPELVALEHPDWLRDIHTAYLDAGSQIIYANTFGANSLKLGARTEEVVAAGVNIARRAAGADKEVKAPSRGREIVKRYFTAQRIATLAMLTAIGYALSWLEFSVFPPASFLKFDFSNVATMLGAYMLGPVGAIVIEGVKQALCLITSTSGGVGQLANFLTTLSFIIVPSVFYKFKKGLPWVAAGQE